MSEIEQVFNNVLAATTASALEEPMQSLLRYACEQTLLSDLWKIFSVARERIATLQCLNDLGEDENIPQNPKEKVINWFGNLAEILAKRNM